MKQTASISWFVCGVLGLLSVLFSAVQGYPQLVPAAWETVSIPSGQWKYYSVFIKNDSSATNNILVELHRKAGDPVLFLKYSGDGGPPTEQDRMLYADTHAAEFYSELHYIQKKNMAAGEWYLAVFNDGHRMNETAEVNLSMTVAAKVPCVSVCEGQCDQSDGPDQGKCLCDPDHAGDTCSFPIAPAPPGLPVAGTIAPGSWFYFAVQIPTYKYRLIIEIKQAGGGQLFLFALPDSPPNVHAHFDHVPITDADSMVIVDYSRLATDVIYFGLYNYDAAKSSICAFTLLTFFAAESGSLTMVTVSITVSAIFLMACILTCCRMLWRRRLYARLSQLALNESSLWPNPWLARFPDPSNHMAAGQESSRGCSPQVIAGLPTFRFAESSEPPPANNDVECIICLSEYKAGELVKGLPCGHKYHSECIDRWLSTSTHCPLCKRSIAPTTTQLLQMSRASSSTSTSGRVAPSSDSPSWEEASAGPSPEPEPSPAALVREPLLREHRLATRTTDSPPL